MLQNRKRRPPAGDTAIAAKERRGVPRLPVIKSAKLILGAAPGQSVLDCLVLDESPNGVMVDLGIPVSLPEEMMIQINGGATRMARRCWSAGAKGGLQFLGGEVMTGETALRMMKIADILHLQGLPAAMSTLRAARFFGHEELRRAAEEAEAALFRFETVLAAGAPR